MENNEKAKIEIPETISMTEADVDRACARPVLRTGWMHLMVQRATKGVAGTGKLKLDLDCVPLDEDGKPGSKATARLSLFPPIANPKQPEAEVAKPKGCYFFARSIDPKFPTYAKKVTQGKYVTRAGEELDTAGSRALERDVNKAVALKTVEWYNDPTMLVQETFYGCIEHDVGQDGTIYPKVKWTRSEKPEEELITNNFTSNPTK